jgi:hypothetical protein
MEKNTVILSAEDYNNLRDFKMEIEKNSILVSNGYSSSKYSTILKDELLEKIAKANKDLYLELDRLHNDNLEKSYKIREYKDNESDFEDKVKNLSIWNFIKIKFKK